MPSETSDSRFSLTMKVNGRVGARLQELATESNTSPSRLAKEILEEIVPKIQSVERRVAIKLRPSEPQR